MQKLSLGLAALASLAGLAGLTGLAAAAPVPAPGGSLSVRVTNLRNAKGQVHIDVCAQAQFLKPDCPYSAVAPAQRGTTMVTVRGLPPGRYAVQAFHDENMNRKVDRVLFGLPREGVGFSNDAPIRMAPPKWSDAVFAFAGGDQTIELKIRYFL